MSVASSVLGVDRADWLEVARRMDHPDASGSVCNW